MAENPTHRTCVSCGATLPIERFYRSGNHSNGRRRACIDCMRREDDRRRRAEGRSRRHPRYNSRGEVWCNRCERYLPAFSFKPHPSRPGTYWSYCKPCVRGIDRERRKRKLLTDPDGALEQQDRAIARKRRRRRAEQRQRRAFVAESILLLRRRGLTKADIARLMDTQAGAILAWERQERRVTPAIEQRIAIVLRETGHLPAQREPAYRRRRPHPEIEQLLARCLPQVRAIPVRNAWTSGRRRKGGAA